MEVAAMEILMTMTKMKYNDAFVIYFWFADIVQGLYNGDGPSDLDREMARFRIKIEKKWGNEHDGTFSYIHTDGTKLPLTPLMIKEWAPALVCDWFQYLFLPVLIILISMMA